jgi:hypothetical protein
MVTAYSPILKLALPVQGELSGTWGDVVNDNITSMVEQAIAGRAVIDTWTTNSHVLTTANGTTSESRCAMLEFTDTGTALSGAGTVTCPTLSKIYIAKNASGQNVTLKTSGGTGILVPNGRTMFLFCDGTNVVEAVTSTTSLQLGTSTIVTAVLDEDNMASDSATSLATQQSIKAYVDSQVGANNELSEVLANGNTSGANDIIMTSGQKITTNTIDETTAASGVTIDSVLLKDDGVNATNLEITNIKANDGTAAGSIADSTGVVTVLSSILTTADINGGTADGVIIGGTTPAAATVTNLIANTDLIIAGTTTITAVLDEDNMASDSATALATQQSIKAYVDSQVGTVDTLAEILAIGNTTGGTDIVASTTDKVQFRDAAIYINSSVDGQLDIVADTEIQIAATTVDVNGALDVSGTALVTGVLTTTAATVHTGGITMPDNAKAIFGDSSDLEIYHDGTQSFISEQGPSSLNILSSQVALNNPANTENMLTAVESGAVTLFHNNAAKLATTATGIDVTGTATMDGLTVSAPSGDTPASIVTITGGSFLQFTDVNTTAGRSPLVGAITDGLSFYTSAGSYSQKLGIDSLGGITGTSQAGGHVVFNEGGIDADFRVESDTNANALFVQGSDGFVGIGTSSPEKAVHVKTAVNNTAVVRIESTAVDSYPTLSLKNDAREYQLTAHGPLGDKFTIYDGTAGSHRLTIDSSGNVGIGTSSPSTELHVVASSGYAELRLQGASGSSGTLEFYDSTTKRGDIYVDTSSNIIFRNTAERMRINSSGGLITTPAAGGHAVFNEGGVDADFRVESDGNANMLFVDGGNNAVGIGTNVAGNSTLEVRSTGVDGTFANAIGFQYSGNSNEANTISTSVSSAAGGSGFKFNVSDGGGSSGKTSVLKITRADMVVNDDSNDIDFRVESASNTHALFVDAGSDLVIMGSSAVPNINGSSPRTFDLSVDKGIAIGNGAFTYGYIGTAGTDGNVQITANSYPANVGSSRYVIINAGSSVGGGPNEVARFDGDTGAVFNEDGIDRDFRVESDTNTHALFVDAGDGKVKINSTIATDGVLLVQGAAAAHPVITVSGSNSNGYTLFADRYLADESILNIGMGYSGANPTFSRSVKPSTTTESAWISSQDSFTAQPAALEIKNDGFRFYHTRTSATTTTDSAVALTSFLHISGDGIIANDSGTTDADFRVESVGNASMFFVDAGLNSVQIGDGTADNSTLLVSKAGDQNEDAPHIRIQGNGFSGYHWLDATAYYIGQNSTLRAVRIYSGAETAGVALTNGSTSWATFSDERLKYDVENVENAVDTLSGLRCVKYRLKDVDEPTSQKKIGLVAQDLVGVLDEVLSPLKRTGDETEYMSVRYTEMVPVLVKAIQEQQTLIETLEARITALENA